ncbi:DNA polymerase III subunit gamma/tau [bacterium]|nr:DNA polymerase III subunit gamma/tau [bacterium]
MAYLVLARKWRPDSWEKLIAQDHVTSTLKNAIQYQRLAHAYLFTGPRGVGKTSAARILAKTLNCENGPVVTPCNTCSNCLEIAEGRSVDVFEIDGASNRGIDEVRNLRENIRYTPAKGNYRIYIIDEVHMLTTEAFNALLKTLEEPPQHVLFIFATTEPHKVPATIVSRCQRFDFRRVSTQHIISHLKTICQDEKIKIEENALLLIARKAEGSIRDSLSILDQMISFTGDQIQVEDVIKALGLIDEELFFKVTEVIAERNLSQCFHLVDKVFKSGYDLQEFLHGLGEHLRNILIVRSTGELDFIEKTADFKKRYREVSQIFQEEDILRMIRIITETSAVLKYSENSRIALEMAIVKMAKLDKTVTLEDLMAKLSQLPMNPGDSASSVADDTPPTVPSSSGPESGEKTSVGTDTSVPKKTSNRETDRPDGSGSTGKMSSVQDKDIKSHESGCSTIDIKTIQLHWEDIVDRVKRKKITVGSFLQEGIPVRMDGDVLEIGFGLSNGFHIDAILRGKSLVIQALKEVLEMNLKFRCVKGDYKSEETVQPTTTDKKAQLEALKKDNEVVRKLMDEFDVEIAD